MRWYLKIQNYDITIKHIRGKENIIADVLSRHAQTGVTDANSKEVIIAKIALLPDKKILNTLKNISNLQFNDEKLASIINRIKGNLGKPLDYYRLYNGTLYGKGKNSNKWRICIPSGFIKELVWAYHDTYGHYGAWKTYKSLSVNYIWKNMRTSVKKIIRTCELCQKSKYLNEKMAGPMKSIIPKDENELVAVDIFGPLPTSVGGVKYVFVVLNVFTKYVILYQIKSPTARTLINKLENDYFLNTRKPASILSDNGTQFMSKLWSTFLQRHNIRNLHCSIRHPASNPSERVMRELGRLLRVFCSTKHSTWAKFIKRIELLINCATSESTELEPIVLEKKIHPEFEVRKLLKIPDDGDNAVNFQIVRQKLLSKAAKRQSKHDNKQKLKKFEVNQLVWLKSNNMSSADNHEIKKLFLLYEGPYRIREIAGHNAYLLENSQTGVERGVFNIVNLKPYKS
nr:unnamed protein product [Callosobruchus analis]